MYTRQFLPFVIRYFKVARFLHNLAFEFDAESGKFVLTKTRSRVISTQFQYIITLIYVGLLSYRLNNLPMLKMLQGFPILFCFVLLASVGSNVSLDIAPVQIINSILKFEKHLRGT